MTAGEGEGTPPDESSRAWYCLGCGVENSGAARLCRECGRALTVSPRQFREGVAFLLNELEGLRADGVVGEDVYLRLRQRYRDVLAETGTPVAPTPAAAAAPPPSPPPVRPAAPAREGPGWLAEQQANLLLYLGAFLIVIAALIFVGYSEQGISSGVQMAVLVLYTIAFLSAGLFCLRFPRVQQAGVVFFAIGALMVPLNFVGAYVFFFADEDIDPIGLWLAGSLSSAVFYGAVSMLGLNRWYPVPLAAALVSGLSAALVLADAPPEAYPVSFIALAFVLAAPSVLPLGRVSEVFGLIGSWAAHMVVLMALIIALAMGLAGEGEGGWLAASLGGALFYGIVSLVGMGRWGPVPMAWYPAPMVGALLSSLGAVLALADAPPEAYPGSFIALAFLFAAPSLLPLGRVSDVFGLVGSWAAHGVVPPALLAALALTPFTAGSDGARAVELATRWYMPPTAALGALFYWTQAPWARRVYPNIEPSLTVAALAVSGGAAVTLVYALDVGEQWYGPAVAIVAWLYASGSERFGPRWFGQRYLGWMALGAITVSWLAFEAIYGDAPRHGAGVHFAATALYLVAARLATLQIPLQDAVLPAAEGGRDSDSYRLPATVALLYAAGLTLGIGFFYLLSSLPAAETAEASDLSWAFFGLSLGVASVAATMRWWWPEVRLHTYVMALGMSLFVLLAAAESEGQVTILLTVYAGVALALALWEREPLALTLPAAFGFFAILAAWRHYEPNDAYLPLAFSGVGYGLFFAYVSLRGLGERAPAPLPRQGLTVSWTLVTLALAFSYVAAAPVVGWVRIDMLADFRGFIGTEHFEETLLYQTAAASVLLLGVLIAAQAWLMRRLDVAAGASAVLMVALLLEIGHVRPENVQAYTAPLGVYLFVGASLALRVRGLPKEIRPLIEPLQALGAAVVMGPSLVQSWQDGGWPYALILFGEGFFVLGLALVQRWRWLLSVATGFIVLDALRYLFDAAQALPNWLIVALAGLLLLGAGTAVLLGRERWVEWQRTAQAWWAREPLPSGAKEG